MKNRRFLLCTMIAALFFIIPGSGIFAQDAPVENAEWTLMFYMDSDNNLEAAQLEDLGEMMTVGSSANINIVVLCDRSAKGEPIRGYTSRTIGGLKNCTTAKLLTVE